MDRNIMVIASAVADIAIARAGMGEILRGPQLAEQMAVAIDCSTALEDIGGISPGQGKAHGPGNRFKPHQGARECARRLRQMCP